MQENINNTLNLFDKLTVRYYDYLYTGSIVKETFSNGGNSGGIIIIGLIIVVVALIGFILTSNRN